MSPRCELNQKFFKKWSSQMAYVLGLFAADGSMIQTGRGGYYIEFTSTDRLLLEVVRSVSHSNHKIQIRDRRRTGWKPQYRIQIGSKAWFKDLELIGFTQNKSKILLWPDPPSKYFGDFVRGYFDGDGCVYSKKLKYADRKNPRWILMTLFTCGCESFLYSLWGELKKSGVNGGSIKKKNRGFELVFSHRDSVALHRVMYNTASVSDLFLPRKRENLEEAIHTLHLRG